jgi:hypothetical protein
MDANNRFTSKTVADILQLYPDMPTADIAAKYNCSISKIYKTAQRYRIKKSEAYFSSEKSGRRMKGERRSVESEFKKGHTPWSKGKKLSEIFKSKEALERTHTGRFKKGNKPATTKYDGAITLRRNINGRNYYCIRVAESRWEFLHRYLWEQMHGEIPKGSNVVFRDGNPMNCVIENLECLTHAELAERNSIGRYPAELQNAIKLKNKIIKKLKNYGKKQN